MFLKSALKPLAVLPLAVALFWSAPEPLAVLSLPVLALSALKPVAVLSLPLALLGPISAKAPMAVFWLAVVMFRSAQADGRVGAACCEETERPGTLSRVVVWDSLRPAAGSPLAPPETAKQIRSEAGLTGEGAAERGGAKYLVEQQREWNVGFFIGMNWALPERAGHRQITPDFFSFFGSRYVKWRATRRVFPSAKSSP